MQTARVAAVLASLAFVLAASSAHAQDGAPPGVAPSAPAPTWAPGPPPPPPSYVPPPSNDGARTANNVIFAELLGNGLLYSVNYERFLSDDLSVRVGFGYVSVNASSSDSSAHASLLTVPVLVNYYVGGVNNKLQLGIGGTFVDVSAATSTAGSGAFSGTGCMPVATGVVGYRYIPHDGGFAFGVGLTPFVGPGGFQAWGGLSLGGVF